MNRNENTLRPGGGRTGARNGTRVYVSIGSNVGDRVGNIHRAVTRLGESGQTVDKFSPLFSTEPVGYQDQPWFLNAALEVDTQLSPIELLEHCQGIENSLGRIRAFRDGPRTVDLDILLYGDRIVDRPDLQIPHPRMTERLFVLKPLYHIAPDAVHPVLGQNIRSLLAACPDKSVVLPYSQGESP